MLLPLTFVFIMLVFSVLIYKGFSLCPPNWSPMIWSCILNLECFLTCFFCSYVPLSLHKLPLLGIYPAFTFLIRIWYFVFWSCLAVALVFLCCYTAFPIPLRLLHYVLSFERDLRNSAGTDMFCAFRWEWVGTERQENKTGQDRTKQDRAARQMCLPTGQI